MDLYVIIMICYFPEYGRGLLLLLVGVTEGRGRCVYPCSVGVVVYGPGRAGRTKVGRAIDGRTKYVMPILPLAVIKKSRELSP